jgi:hypothetical protein
MFAQLCHQFHQLFPFQAFVETQGRYSRGQMILEKRFGGNDADANVEIVDEVDMKLVKRLMTAGMAGTTAE